MCCLILMMPLTLSPMHCFMYIFLSHLSSLIVLDFVFVPFHPTVLYIPLDLCLINFFHADFLSFSAAFISTPVSLLIELTLLQKVCWRFYLHCSLTMFFAMCSSLLFIMLWYSIIALYCKYSLAVHIPVFISTPAVMLILGLAVTVWVLCFARFQQFAYLVYVHTPKL